MQYPWDIGACSAFPRTHKYVVHFFVLQCTGNAIKPPVELDLHYVPQNLHLQYFGRLSAFFLLAMLLLTG